MNKNGKLYSVATPIGNLSDISFRAIEILKSVDLIAAEDTRHSKLLLDHFQINTPMISYHHHNETLRSEQLIQKLQAGQNIALISDAGTPIISDPGANIVSLCHENNIQVVPIPGACALITALSAAGMIGSGVDNRQQFLFLGFLPAKQSQREKELEQYQDNTTILICYEAPHRILSMLASCKKIFGDTREICIAKELTKSFETIIKSTPSDLINWLEHEPARQKGEFVVLISSASSSKSSNKPETVSIESQKLLKQLLPIMTVKQACKITCETFGDHKNQLYQFALSLKA